MTDPPAKRNTLVNNPATRAVGRVLKDLANDPFLYQWIGHGASELANIVVKGQPAPIYSRSAMPASPASAEPQATVHGPPASPNSVSQDSVAMHEPDITPEITLPEPELHPEPSVLDQLVEQAETMVQAPEPELEISQ